MHSPSVWGISPHIPPLCRVSLPLSVSLSLRCCNISVTALPVIRWRGHGACQISKSAAWPKNKWGGDFKSADKCRGGSLFNLRVQTLPQDVASVFCFFFLSHFFFFPFIVTKIRTRQKERCFGPKAECGKERGHEEEMRISSGYDKRCNWPNASYGTGLVLPTSALHHYFFYPPTKNQLTRGLPYTDDSKQVPPSGFFSSKQSTHHAGSPFPERFLHLMFREHQQHQRTSSQNAA